MWRESRCRLLRRVSGARHPVASYIIFKLMLFTFHASSKETQLGIFPHVLYALKKHVDVYSR